jgi:hypothetical protein
MSPSSADTFRPSPAQILATGRAVVARPTDDWGSLWARAAAFFIRQALEETVAAHWTGPLTELTEATLTTQLICLREYLGDSDLARRVQLTWYSLSNACHAHPYELAPTAPELHTWADTVEELLGHLS